MTSTLYKQIQSKKILNKHKDFKTEEFLTSWKCYKSAYSVEDKNFYLKKCISSALAAKNKKLYDVAKKERNNLLSENPQLV